MKVVVVGFESCYNRGELSGGLRRHTDFQQFGKRRGILSDGPGEKKKGASDYDEIESRIH